MAYPGEPHDIEPASQPATSLFLSTALLVPMSLLHIDITMTISAMLVPLPDIGYKDMYKTEYTTHSYKQFLTHIYLGSWLLDSTSR